MAQSFDLSPRSYDQWRRLIFDHPTSSANEDEAVDDTRWPWNVDFHVSNPLLLVEHATRLWHEFRVIEKDYSLPQIDQGIWFLLGPNQQFGDYLAAVDIPLDKRVECVRAMLHPYVDFVAGHPVEVMENCFDMWWDMLCGDFWSAHLRRLKCEELDAASGTLDSPEDEEQFLKVAAFWASVDVTANFDEQLQAFGLSQEDVHSPTEHIEVSYDELEDTEMLVADAMLETLTAILALDDDRCQGYALHGLGHLHHPGSREVVQLFIDQHGDEWSDEELKWVEACRDGTVM